MSLVGRVFTNRYEIEREIAQGGMAEVYLARDRLLDRPVALKALFPEYAREPSFVERFRREAQAAANLNQPNIVAIYDWGQESGTYFIVMEHVEGRSLRDLIRGEGPLDAHQAAEITSEIAAALAFAHRSGVVHRDVKPGNVLLTRSGTVKVTDFGIARAGTSDGLTQTGSVMGTATYFSPEQAQGFPVDGRSDVYSLGVVLYEMVTGVVPFTGDSPVAVAYKHVREEPVPPSRRNPDVPPDLEQIILTALAKDPDHRYQTADDMRADLLRFRRGRALAAAPVTALVAEVTPAAAAAGVGAYAASATMQGPRIGDGPPTGTGPYAPMGRRPGSRRALVTTLTVLVLVLIVAGIFFVSRLAAGDGPQADVPNVVDLDVEAATLALERDGFEVDRRNEPNADVAENIVFEQDPAAGDRVDKGSTVTIKVSVGAGQKEVPNVDGETRTDAAQILIDAGFAVELDGERSDNVPKDYVIRTEPPAGTLHDAGGTVTLIVSQGPEPIEVPSVEGETSENAARILREAGFTANPTLQDQASDTVDEGRVIGTDPEAGTTADVDTPITIFISTGTDRVRVPNVIAQTEADARAAIEALGLLVRTIVDEQPAANVGKVVAQDPPSGTLLDPGATVILTIGVPSSSSTTGSSGTTPTT